MDEMKIRSKFTKGLISKFLEKLFHRKTGCYADIQLNDISLEDTTDGMLDVHIDASFRMSNSELKSLLISKSII